MFGEVSKRFLEYLKGLYNKRSPLDKRTEEEFKKDVEKYHKIRKERLIAHPVKPKEPQREDIKTDFET